MKLDEIHKTTNAEALEEFKQRMNYEIDLFHARMEGMINAIIKKQEEDDIVIV